MPVKIGPIIKVEGERDYRTAMKEITAETKRLKSEMDLLSSTFSKEGKTLAQNRKEHQNLTKQIEQTEKALREQQNRLQEVATATTEDGQRTQELKNKTAEFQAIVNSTEAELNQLKAQLKALPNDMQLAGQHIQDTGNKLKDNGKAVADFGKDLTRLTAPLAAAGAAAIKFGAEFDAGMSNVKAVMNTTDEGFEALRETAISWGEKTVYTAKEVSDGLYYMGLAGWSAEESISSIGGVLNLAAAGALDLGRTSDIVTDGMTALGMAADGATNGIQNAEHFSNVLAATMSNSNTTVDMLGEAFKYVAPVAGSLGYNIEDLSIALGLMANAGIKSSQAGTTLRNILNRMAKPTKESADAMAALGVSLDDGQGGMLSFMEVLKDLREGLQGVDGLTQFKDQIEDLDYELANGVITEEHYNETLEELIGTTKDAALAEKLRYAAQLAGLRGMSGLLAIANATDEEFQALTDTVYSADDAFDGLGYAAGMAETQMDNLKGDFTKLTSALGTAQIKISDVANNTLRDLVKSLTDLVVKFNNLDKSQQEQIVKFAAMAVAAGPAIFAYGKLQQGIGALITGFGKGVSAVGTFTKAMGEGKGVLASLTATGFNPLNLAIGAVVASIGLAMAEMKRYNTFLEENVTGQYKLTEEEEKLATAIQNRADKYATLVEGMTQEGEAILLEHANLEQLVTDYNRLIDSSGEVRRGHEEEANVIINQLASALGIEVEKVRELIGENGKLTTEINTLIEAKQREALLDAYHDDYIQSLKDQKAAQTDLVQALADKQARDEGLALAEANLKAAQDAYTQASRDGTEQLVDYQNKVDLAKTAVEAAKAAQDEATATYNTARETLDNYTSTVTNYENFQKAVVSGSDNIGEAQTRLVNNIKTAETASRTSLQQQYNDAVTNYNNIQNAYKTGSEGVTAQAVAEAKNLVTLTKAELDKAPAQAESAGSQTTADFGRGIESGEGPVISSAARTKAGAIKAMEGGNTYSIGYNLASGTASGIDGAAGNVIARARALVSNAVQAMKTQAQIYSPSHVTRDEIGKQMVAGIIKGYDAEEKALEESASSLINDAINSMTQEARNVTVPIGIDAGMNSLQSAADASIAAMSGLQTGTTNKSVNAPISVNVNVNGNVENIDELARTVADVINDEVIRRNEVFA